MNGSVLYNLSLKIALKVRLEVMETALGNCRFSLIEASWFVHVVPYKHSIVSPYIVFRILALLGNQCIKLLHIVSSIFV